MTMLNVQCFSVSTWLFQLGVFHFCFSLTWGSVWGFFRGGFSQIIQLNRWGWLLDQWAHKRSKGQTLQPDLIMTSFILIKTHRKKLTFSHSTQWWSTYLHEVICNVFWLQTRDSLGGGLRHINSEVSGLQPAEVCKQVSGLSVQRWGRTQKHLEQENTGKNCVWSVLLLGVLSISALCQQVEIFNQNDDILLLKASSDVFNTRNGWNLCSTRLQ